MTDRASDDRGAAAFCADLVRTHDFARYAATIFVAAEVRRALLALYAFNVEVTRVREQVTQALPGEIRLQWWSDMLAGRAHGSAEANPVAAELMKLIQVGELPVETLSRLIDEHQFDLYNDPMPTMAALEGYLNDTASALFALAARIAGGPPSPEVDHLARHAGLAQGFVRVIATLAYDASRRQLFLPQQVLAQHGSDLEEVFAGKLTPRLRAAADQLLAEARRHLDTAYDLLADAPREVRRVFLPLAVVRRDLKRLCRADHDPFASQPPSRLSTLWTLWRASRSRQFNG
ncbi:phytoene/squalene synthase family protein [Bradyrhizobium sp. Tv2a-2]|uniref:phytoene/squalene synthase family protein n=1 Tax=Bradyrhizobium sp. Tv2a-2 TaxID=113395 RepID=UPI0004255939|nr:phytoene/squalene synthase family protein [Bradyrhizobium sp. Tv2a-2]